MSAQLWSPRRCWERCGDDDSPRRRSRGLGALGVSEPLDALLRECALEGPVWYHPNPGNAGDALIAHATYALFDRLGVTWLPADGPEFVSEGRNVVYGGGGNLVPGYDIARRFLSKHHASARRMILLPHTVDGNEDLLGDMGPNVHLFLRETRSMEHCARHAAGARIHQDHDLALSLPSDRMARPGLAELAVACLVCLRRRDPPRPKMVAMVVQRILREGYPKGQILTAFRRDRESAGRPLPPGNRDLSETFLLGSMEPRWASLSARLLLGWVSGASLVRTDRLHVAIACCLTSVPVEMHANSNHKLRSVYDHSIRDRFPRASWGGVDER